MKTYWDHTNQERAQLSAEYVTSLLDAEMMVAGVRKPTPPVLQEVPASPLGAKSKYFGVHAKGKYGSDEILEVVFTTAEQAQAFIDLCPCGQDYDYDIGSEFRYAKPLNNAVIQQIELYSWDSINKFHSSLKQWKAASEQNAKLQSSFTEASNKAEKITNKVWEDYYQQRQTLATMTAIADTFDQYKKLTEGNEDLAVTFLGKLYEPETLNECREWLPNRLPSLAQPATA
jgi:hypothetical protein